MGSGVGSVVRIRDKRLGRFRRSEIRFYKKMVMKARRVLGLMLTRSPCYRILGMSVTGMLLRLPPPGRMWPIRRPKSSVGLPALLSA
jgi:hypothetical protein